MQQFLQDVRFSLRMIRKNPPFFLVVILTLALGIGATTSVFSVVNAVLLRPLAYKDSDRIMLLFEERKSDSSKVWGRIANFLDWRAQNRVFEHLAHYTPKNFTLSGNDGPEAIAGAETSASFFRVLAEEPLIGRGFHPEDEQPGAEPVVVLSHNLWKTHFGADQSWLGRSVNLDNKAHTVVGVMPPEFEFSSQGKKQNLWTSKVFSEAERADRDHYMIMIIGRLKAGISLTRAQADMDRVAGSLAELYPGQNEDWGVWMRPLQEQIVGKVKFSLMILLGCVTVVLLIACANVINLLLARSTVRAKELALRVALGAGRGRLIRHFLTESMVLSALGALGGLLLVMLSLKLLVALGPGMIPRLNEVDVDARVLGFTLVITLFVTVAFGLVMSFKAFHMNLLETISSASAQPKKERGHLKLRNMVVAAEIGLVLGLVIFGALLLKSYRKLSQVDPGFERDGRIAVEISLPSADYPDVESVIAFFDRLLEELDALPGIEASAVTTNLPLGETRWASSYMTEGTVLPESDMYRALFDAVSTDYFRAMGIRLIAGRLFTAADRGGAPEVAVVNHTMANKHWTDETAVGHFLHRENDHHIEIVGVVEDVRSQSLNAEGPEKFYASHTQMFYYPTRQVVVWTKLENPADAVPMIRDAVLQIDDRQPITKVVMLEDLVNKSIARHRFNMFVFMILGFIGLFLGTVGVYGVVSYSVGRRTQEMGIRLALGARRADVLKLVLGTELIPVLVGVGLGIGTALALSRMLSSLLYEVSTNDPLFYAGGTCLLFVVTLPAVSIPAFRASRVDPMTSVRYE